MFTKRDHQQFRDKGIPPIRVEEQVAIFRQGIPFPILDRPCTIGDGIIRLQSSELDYYAEVYRQWVASGRVTKFVPASGAASRMFKSLLAYRHSVLSTMSDKPGKTMLSQSDREACQNFFDNIKSFAFFIDLDKELSNQGFDISDLLHTGEYHAVLERLLFSSGLNYAHLPKGLIKFHRYPQCTRNPIEEHIVEGLGYAKDSSNTVRLHFTVSPEHHAWVENYLAATRVQLVPQGVVLEITCSLQKSSTDTIAVDLHNEPFRGNDGRLVFRPGGHGALLENLSNLKGDLVFIKNIDNVVHERLIHDTIRYKKALGGVLISIQEQLFSHLQVLTYEKMTPELCRQMRTFVQETLGLSIPGDLLNWSNQKQKTFFAHQFNRPLRICGVVPNTGEAGGGPFWVKHPDGSISFQIVESSQVDPSSADQQGIWRSSTHFNPVDLVCGLRDFQGNSFKLQEFSDPDSGIITQKSFEGRDLKALELPGLWNGAMARWNTIFVEVPPTTFNPVKTVFDLLRSEHQPSPSGDRA